MGLKNTFGTDRNLETKGVIVDFGSVRVLVARAGGSNQAYSKALADAARPHRRAIANEVIDEGLADRIMHQAFAEHVVKQIETKVDGEWRVGIDPTDLGRPAGDLLPVTDENILELFRALPDFFRAIQDEANRLSNFRHAVNEKLAGN